MSAQAPPLQVPQPKRRYGRSGEGSTRERLQGVAFALPALIVNWVTIADSYGELAQNFDDRFAIFIRLGIIDLAAWLLPLANGHRPDTT